MKVMIQAALLVVLLAVGGYTSTAWWIGMSAEKRLQQNEEQLLNSASYLTLVSRDYRRGIFSSTEDVTYGIGGSVGQLLRTSGAGAALNYLRLTVHNDIQHGPLPGFRTVAFATIDSRLQPPPALRQAVDTILHGRPLLQARAVLEWSGDSEISVESPSFQYRLPDSTRLVWDGVAGSARATSSMAHWSGHMSAPGLAVDGPKGQFELLGLTLSADMQRALDTFYIGRSEIHLGSVTAREPSGTALSIKGVGLQSDTGLNAGYIDQYVSLSAERADVAQFSLTHVGYEQTLSHLHAGSLAALVAALRDAQRELPSGPPTRVQTARAQTTAFSRYGLALAVHEPVLNIERFGFIAPEGEFRLSAKLAIPGLSQQELQGPAAMAAVMMHLDASAELHIDAPLLDKLLQASGKRELVGAQLEQLEHQGYLRRDGNALTTSLAFHAGALTINGLPYRPTTGTTMP
jgi:uncharacterized protein YdgA (DUF945 family)